MATIPRAVSAQTLQMPQPRQGFYVSLGGGAQALTAWDKGHRQGPWFGPSYGFHVGEMLTDTWGLGLGMEGGSGAHQGLTSAIGGITLEAQARLWRNLAWHVGTGLGVSTVNDPARIDDETHGGYGSLVTTSMSYDAFVTRRPTGGWAVTPSLGLRALRGGDVNALSVFATLSLSWWSGLPARELRDVPTAQPTTP